MTNLVEGRNPPKPIIDCPSKYTTGKLGVVFCPTAQKETNLSTPGTPENAATYCQLWIEKTCPWIILLALE